MSVTATIEFDGIPEGYEPVRFGVPKQGEFYLHKTLILEATQDHYIDPMPVLIIRPVWLPPAWLKPGWIASNKGAVWLWFDHKPVFKSGKYWAVGDTCPVVINRRMLDFTPPPCTEPAKSLREIKEAT